MSYSKVLVSFIVLMNLVFTGVILYMFWNHGFEPTSLIVAWFAWTTGELWALSKIKRTEVESEWKKENTGF